MHLAVLTCGFVLALAWPRGAAAVEEWHAPSSQNGEVISGLSEDEAVALALRENPDLRTYRKQQNIAEGQIVSATALQNPFLRFDVLHIQESDPSLIGWDLNVKWMPPQPVEWLGRRDQARARLSEVRSDIAEQERSLASAVRINYMALLELAEQRRFFGESLALRQRIAGLMREKLQRGGVTRLEVNLLELAIVHAQVDLNDIELRLVQQQAQLRGLLGIVSTEPLLLTGSITTELGDEPTPDPVELTEQALATRPALRAAAARIVQREQAVRIEKSRRWPWIELSGRYRQQSPSKYVHDGQLGVEFALPILNLNSGPLRVAEAELDREQSAVQAQVIALKQTIYAACAELNVRRSILQRFRHEVLPVLAEHERLMTIAARSAEVDMIALLSSEESVLRGRREYSDARLTYRRARLALAAAVGSPL